MTPEEAGAAMTRVMEGMQAEVVAQAHLIAAECGEGEQEFSAGEADAFEAGVLAGMGCTIQAMFVRNWLDGAEIAKVLKP